MRIGDLCSYAPKSQLKAGQAIEGAKYMFFTSSADETKRYSDYQLEGEGIIMGTGGNATLHYYSGKYAASTDCVVLLPDERIKCKYLYYFFRANMHVLEAGFKGAGLKHTNKRYIDDICIDDIPDYERQDEVIFVLDSLQGIISKKNEELLLLDELVRGRFVELFGDPVHHDKGWETDTVENLCEKIYGGGTPSKAHPEYYEEGDIPWVSSKDMKTDVLTDSQIKINQLGVDNSTAKIVPVNSVIVVIRSGILKHTLPVAINAVPITVNQDLKVFIPGESIVSRFLSVQFKMHEKDILTGVRAVTADNIEFNMLKQRELIVPPIELQKEYVTFLNQIDKSKFRGLSMLTMMKSAYEQQALIYP